LAITRSNLNQFARERERNGTIGSTTASIQSYKTSAYQKAHHKSIYTYHNYKTQNTTKTYYYYYLLLNWMWKMDPLSNSVSSRAITWFSHVTLGWYRVQLCRIYWSPACLAMQAACARHGCQIFSAKYRQRHAKSCQNSCCPMFEHWSACKTQPDKCTILCLCPSVCLLCLLCLLLLMSRNAYFDLSVAVIIFILRCRIEVRRWWRSCDFGRCKR